jgi:ribosomal protein S12 methylthiotransferase
MNDTDQPKQQNIGFVSLGCPKALVDSERILTRLRGEGYATSANYENADIVVVNTCGFIDSAKEESLSAINEALSHNTKVVVTGCLGDEVDLIRTRFPNVSAITGAHQYDAVMDAIHDLAPPRPDPLRLYDENELGVKLTPSHYGYLKISEGCNHRCSFCIIPSFRGDLASRPIDEVLKEAEIMANSGIKEILVISQDTSAYGVDIKHQKSIWHDKPFEARLDGLCEGLGSLGVWVRLHYVYPYPHVDRLIPLMREGKILPYLDIPFQHANARVLKSMKRPAHSERTLERIESWRSIMPDLTIRSTFIVGFPGETEAEFEELLDWISIAGLNRIGAFAYENVKGAAAQDLPDHIPEAVKQERLMRFMAVARNLSEAQLRKRVGAFEDVIIDTLLPHGGAIGRTKGDAPEIDGKVHLKGVYNCERGDIIKARITRSDAHDLWAEPFETRRLNQIPTIRKPMRTVLNRRS